MKNEENHCIISMCCSENIYVDMHCRAHTSTMRFHSFTISSEKWFVESAKVISGGTFGGGTMSPASHKPCTSITAVQ